MTTTVDALFVQFVQKLEHLARALGVELSGRLVQHERARAQRQNRRKRDLLLLPAGKRGNLPRAQIRDAHLCQRLFDARQALIARNAEVLQPERKLVFHHGRDHLRVDVLEDRADRARKFGKVRFERVASCNADAAVEVAVQAMRDGPHRCVRQRRFARARRADDAQEVAFLHPQAHAVERFAGRPFVRKGHILEYDHALPFLAPLCRKAWSFPAFVRVPRRAPRLLLLLRLTVLRARLPAVRRVALESRNALRNVIARNMPRKAPVQGVCPARRKGQLGGCDPPGRRRPF